MTTPPKRRPCLAVLCIAPGVAAILALSFLVALICGTAWDDPHKPYDE